MTNFYLKREENNAKMYENQLTVKKIQVLQWEKWATELSIFFKETYFYINIINITEKNMNVPFSVTLPGNK